MNIIDVELVGYVALVTGVLSYTCKTQNHVRYAMAISSVFWAIHYFFLGAYTSGSTHIMLVIRAWGSTFLTRTYQKHVLFWSTSLVIVGLTIYTWQGLSSLLPLAAAINASVAFCYMSNENMRKMLVGSSMLWLFNGYIWNSMPQMIAEVVKISVNMYMLFYMDKQGEFVQDPLVASAGEGIADDLTRVSNENTMQKRLRQQMKKDSE